MNQRHTIAEKLAGKFVVFDGPDGCGKTTQCGLFGRLLESYGANVVQARDPGGTGIGDRIREILLGRDLSSMDVRCETLLFMASRAQLVAEVIDPALAAGDTVLCDRFISSTYAYQGAAGYDTTDLQNLANRSVGRTWPDLTLVLDVPVEEGFARLAPRPGTSGPQAELDAMESRPRDFHRRVREIFQALPELYPKPVHIVDGTGLPDQVHARIVDLITQIRASGAPRPSTESGP